MVPIVVCLALTKSRSGYIAAGVGVVSVWLLSRQRRFHIGWKLPAAVAVVTSFVVLGALLGGFDRELYDRASKSFGYRLQYWQASLRMIADHPIVGCGPGNFQNAYTQYKLPEASEEVADPHNFLLEIWATAGTPAALAFVAVLACFAWSILQRGLGTSVPSESPMDLRSRLHAADTAEDKIPISHHPYPKSDAWPYILAGGACGFVLSIPIGLLSAAPPTLAVVLWGLPLAIAAMIFLWPWIRDGRLPRWLPAVGVVALLVDLLAAGGIGLPSVAGTFWLLVAVGLPCERPRELRWWVAWVTLLAAMALAVACYRTAYSPVLGCQAQLRLAERKPTQAIEHLTAAAAADPWAAEPWRQLAAIELERWWQQPDPVAFAHFEQANAHALRLATNSAPIWLGSGDSYFRAFTKLSGEKDPRATDVIKAARSAYCEAVRLYPNNGLYRARLAEACRAAGDQSGFRREAQMALRLDGLTPHSDKKLPADLRERLVQGLGTQL